MSAAAPEAAGRPEPFSRLAALVVAGIGIAGFAAFLVFGAFARDADRDLRGGSALSDSAIGFAGIVTLLRAEGVPVAVARAAPGADRDGLLVLTPPPGDGPLPREMLDDGAGPVLVVLPKWRVHPLPGHPGWVESRGTLDVAEAGRLMPAATALHRGAGQHRTLHGGTGRFEALSALPVVPLDPAQTVETSADWTPLLLDEDGAPVLARWTGHDVYLLADPDLIDTRGLATADGARTALAVIDALRDGDPVTFDVTLDGFGVPPNLLRLLFGPPLLGATLCGAAAGLLVLLMALHRFGPAAPPERVHEFGKRALADNSAGLIALARREPRMAGPYAQLLRGQALRDLNAPPRLDAGAADRLLDAASRSRGLPEDWTALAGAAAAVRGPAGLLDVAARLYRWEKGMTRDDR